ncbi:Uma2 family endonuclease [Pyxidicoccus fallax]|uniref:Uma2 family endonuclease n=1 Tax=Pyxidicoccus fallax TaxID=394095 RepID=A0A848LYI7_9BACT|nr:Uma2 family endonuclease [Pyxidicoccus fallax]NMO22691.1 Uma2 family endonuclease [Pyxidicoccus fallax]NPC84772.1 Uma2 family endonuclease [Pyxidicoccus fallax]
MKYDSEKRRDDHPRAPSQSEWDAMTPEEQARVYASLPGEVTDAELALPEGDRHFLPKVRAFDTLTGHFERERRRIYLACELPVYYPAERRFAPDLLAVVDAEPGERDKWVVSAEGRGLDLVLEVHVGGDRKKDAERNVARYARLGIPEYFIYDGGKRTLYGYRLTGSRTRKYVPIKPVQGRLPSKRLGLALQVEDGRLRFYENDVQLLESAEFIGELQKVNEKLRRSVRSKSRSLKKEAQLREEAQQRLAEETRLREEAQRQLAEETRRREETQRELKQLQAEFARLKNHRG